MIVVAAISRDKVNVTQQPFALHRIIKFLSRMVVRALKGVDMSVRRLITDNEDKPSEQTKEKVNEADTKNALHRLGTPLMTVGLRSVGGVEGVGGVGGVGG